MVDDSQKRFVAIFLDEAERHIGALKDGFAALARKPDLAQEKACLESCFRSAHTLKGASAAVGLTSIEEASRQIEGSLSAMRSGSSSVEPDGLARLAAIIGGIEESCRSLREDREGGRPKAPAEPGERPATEAPPSSSKRRVVVADDSMTARTIKQRILESAGYDVTAAADGEAAYRLLESQGADLLVSDIEMPNMDGLALTRALRASGRFRDLGILLVSGHESEEQRALGIEAGANDYFAASGFDAKTFLAVVRRLL